MSDKMRSLTSPPSPTRKRKRETDSRGERDYKRRKPNDSIIRHSCGSCRSGRFSSDVQLKFYNGHMEWIACRCSISKDMEDLFEKEIGADISFVVKSEDTVEPEIIYAHKAILMSRSEYFSGMFSSSFSEGTSSRIEINDVSPAVFRELLRFTYSERANLKPEMMIEFMVAANRFLFWRAVRYATEYAKKMAIVMSDEQRSLLLSSAMNASCPGSLIRAILPSCDKPSVMTVISNPSWPDTSRKTACNVFLKLTSFSMDPSETAECLSAMSVWYERKMDFLISKKGVQAEEAATYAEELFYFFPSELCNAAEPTKASRVSSAVVARYMGVQLGNPMRITCSIGKGKLARSGRAITSQMVANTNVKIVLDSYLNVISIYGDTSFTVGGGIVAIYDVSSQKTPIVFRSIPYGSVIRESQPVEIPFPELHSILKVHTGFDIKIVVHLPKAILKNKGNEETEDESLCNSSSSSLSSS